MIKSIAACAQRFMTPRPTACAGSPSRRRAALVGQADELKVIAAAARELGLRLHSHLSETDDMWSSR